ncbi:Arv1-like family-domain-containing protein [Microdochium bolleyi]|uniref:Protein ARV n=1 Tax=Microdochium bolleyi TaxID=196109 RepID=A0A136ILM0_9PEZI|nr:Arv1-like family-domain-containing protein [Microdochium bolleyi]
MPICIECQTPVRTLWTEYRGGTTTGPSSKSATSGHNIRLTVCKNCGRFCDKYVEHDYVVLFIDLVLIKPQVYRHLLHNTLMSGDGRDRWDASIVRLGVLLLLFDVYLTWARIEKLLTTQLESAESANLSQAPPGHGAAGGNAGPGTVIFEPPELARQPIVLQYMFFLILCTLSTLAFHMSIRFLTSSRFSPLSFLGLLRQYPRPNSVSTALLVSSSTKLFPILMVVWDYDVPAAARSLGWAVVANNVEALKILLDCGYGVAVLLAAAGALSRWAVGRGILALAGLEHVDAAAMVGGGPGGGGGAGPGSIVVGFGGDTGGHGFLDSGALADWFGHFREWGGRLAVG